MAIGGPGLGDPEKHFIIITEYNRQTQGFLVGSVERIVNLNWREIMAPPAGITEGSYMTAVTQVEDELVEIIDVEKVLKEVIGDSEVVSDGIIDESVSREDQNVLVVDDSSVARNQIKRVLDQLGVNSILCGDGKQALKQLRDLIDQGIRVADHIGLVISEDGWLYPDRRDSQRPGTGGAARGAAQLAERCLQPGYGRARGGRSVSGQVRTGRAGEHRAEPVVRAPEPCGGLIYL